MRLLKSFDLLRCAFRFRRDQRGGLSTWFAFMLLPMIAVAGAAVDLSRGFNQKAQMQSAVDAAALAGAATYVGDSYATAAATVANNYMAQFKTSSSLTGLTYQATSAKITNNGQTVYKMTVQATASIQNAFMSALGKSSSVVGVTATAQNPVYSLTLSVNDFTSSAADSNSIYYYVVPTDNSAPSPTSSAVQLLFDNSSGSPLNLTQNISLAASQSIGFMLKNVTGGRTTTTTTTTYQSQCVIVFFFLRQCTQVPVTTTTTTPTTNYTNQYGGTAGSTHYFYSNILPPSKSAYPSVTQNCSLIVAVGSANTTTNAGQCFSSLFPNSSVNCSGTNSGQTFWFDWNDMGGTTDDRDYNDMVYKVTCPVTTGLGSQSLSLTN